MKKLDPQVAKRIKESNDGIHLIEFLGGMVDRLDSIDGIPNEWDDRRVAIAVAARKRSRIILLEILKPFSLNVPEELDEELDEDERAYLGIF